MRYEWYQITNWFLRDNQTGHSIAYIDKYGVIIYLYNKIDDTRLDIRYKYSENTSLEDMKADILKAIEEGN